MSAASIKPPRGEQLWVSIWDVENKHRIQIVTSNAMRTKYYLYNVGADGSLTKIETNDIPVFDKMKV